MDRTDWRWEGLSREGKADRGDDGGGRGFNKTKDYEGTIANLLYCNEIH